MTKMSERVLDGAPAPYAAVARDAARSQDVEHHT
jgi:hypothetical protein